MTFDETIRSAEAGALPGGTHVHGNPEDPGWSSPTRAPASTRARATLRPRGSFGTPRPPLPQSHRTRRGPRPCRVHFTHRIAGRARPDLLSMANLSLKTSCGE